MPRRVYRPYGAPKSKARSRAEYDRDRRDPEAARFYQSAAWRKLRAEKLAIDPLCEHCRRRGRFVQAKHVHHVKPRAEFPELALDLANLESACPPCHNRIEPRTRRPSDGG